MTRLNTTFKKIIALVVVLVFLGAGGTYLALQLSKPSGDPLSTTPDCLSHRSSFCTGVALKQVTKGDISSFTKSTGIFPAIIEYYQAFGKSFSKVSATRVASVGARPFIQLNPHKISMTAIESGQYDSYIKTYALAVKAFGHPVMLSFGHEMNGDWSSWSLPYTKPADFIGAWRHIHEVFVKLKVKNVLWSWDISHASSHHRPAALWWPGAQYVDWIGIDGYLRPKQSFAGQFEKVIGTVRKLGPRKPVFIAETAVAPGPAQVTQIKELFTGAEQRSLRALIWFNVNRLQKWQLQTNSAAASAFRTNANAAMIAASPTPSPSGSSK